ncbi:protein ALWAYS EARLY 3 isoform X2 [Cornus florida]|uniref:protein ALWAYS EARLY 3 isoform X2 n=1 Tax=Cornus florida TaxID=4283 RepID=UPI00289E5229|nr:protein ALWAYS EARLY 3 isoform X2 [Cornus florida]
MCYFGSIKRRFSEKEKEVSHNFKPEGNDSDRESNDTSRLSRKPQKRGRRKVQVISSKEDVLQSQSVASTDGCLSLLKRRRSDGCAVGKRTPRYPVSYSFRKYDGESYDSPSKKGWKSEVDKVAHVAALALTEASQRGGPLQVSHSPFKTERMKPLLLQSQERMHLKSQMAKAKLHDTGMDEDCLESSLNSRGAENGDYPGDTSALMDVEVVDTTEVYQKGKKVYRKRENVKDIRTIQFDDGREECSGTEGLNVRDAKRNIKVTNVKIERSFSQSKRRRDKKLFFGDESAALDALQTLADLSLMMPASTIESESSEQLNEENPTLDVADRSSVPEAMPGSHGKDETKLLGVREKAFYAFSGAEASMSGKSKLGRDSAVIANSLSEGEQQPQSSSKVWKRKHKFSSLKAFSKEDENSVFKAKRTGQNFAPSKQLKSFKTAECSSNSDQQSGIDLAVSTAEAPARSQVNSLTKQRSRRKMDPKRMSIQDGMMSREIISKDLPNKYSTSLKEGVFYRKDMLSCCLSSYMVRRWCTFEWFYNAIDYPWFAKREFVEYLDHVGLGHIPRLTRVEWGVIRSSLGKPRRFSEQFLREEKEKLLQYRTSVRKHYTELRTGIGDGLPTDLARPLSVGQRVIALHPKSREVHNGSVLTVDRNKCRVQFDLPELGVEFVMDIDCMPLNPLENMPEALRKQHIAFDKFVIESRGSKAGQSNIGGPMVFAPIGHLDNACSPMHTVKKEKVDTNHATSRAIAAAVDIVSAQQAAYSQPSMVAHIHAREVDVSSATLKLRKHNTYSASRTPWLKPPAVSSGPDHCSSNYQESGSNVVEIVKDSRCKAHTMVDTALKAMSSMKEGEDAFTRIGEVLDSLNKRNLSLNRWSSVVKSPEQFNSGVVNQPQLTSSKSELPLMGHLSGPKGPSDSDRVEAQIPSELITSCVATLLMVQMCTERQYPPADVAQMLDFAVTSLHPCCPQNLPIYRELQMCMGRIKTQILALMPT